VQGHFRPRRRAGLARRAAGDRHPLTSDRIQRGKAETVCARREKPGSYGGCWGVQSQVIAPQDMLEPDRLRSEADLSPQPRCRSAVDRPIRCPPISDFDRLAVMTSETHPDQLTLKIHPAEGGSEVPVSLLIQSLTTLQELIHLFALQEEGRELRQRLRLSAEHKSKYVLRCGPPVTGSFAITSRVARTSKDLFAADDVTNVVKKFHEFGRAAVAH